MPRLGRVLARAAFWLALALALPAYHAAADQPDEQLARFHCAAKLSVPGGGAVWLPCLSEDLPTPGFANRWHYVLGPAAAQLLHNYDCGQVYYARVCGSAVEGGMWMAAEGHWRLDMVPTAPNVARDFTAVAGASECRWQWFQVKPLPEGYVEVLIEEPLDPATDSP